MTPEQIIQREICDYLKDKGVFFFRVDRTGIYDAKRKCFRVNRDPYRRKGVADILGIWNRQMIAIEVKTKKKYPTKEQKEFIADVIKYGGFGFVARSVDDVKSMLFADTGPPGACF